MSFSLSTSLFLVAMLLFIDLTPCTLSNFIWQSVAYLYMWTKCSSFYNVCLSSFCLNDLTVLTNPHLVCSNITQSLWVGAEIGSFYSTCLQWKKVVIFHLSFGYIPLTVTSLAHGCFNNEFTVVLRITSVKKQIRLTLELTFKQK